MRATLQSNQNEKTYLHLIEDPVFFNLFSELDAFDKINNIGPRMADSIYHLTLKLL